MAYDLDSSDSSERILLVPDLFQAKLLRISKRLQMSFGRPLEIILIAVQMVRFKHWQMSDSILQQLNMRRCFDCHAACSNRLKLFLRLNSRLSRAQSAATLS